MGFQAPGWSCDPKLARPEIYPVIIAALRSIGIREIPPGSNSGPEIDIVLKKAGVPPGSAWCASILSDWYATMKQPVMPRMASAYKIHNWAEKHGRLVDLAGDLLPGDILGVFQKDNPATPKREDFHGHVALYTGPLKDGGLATIEGNVQSACRALIRSRSDWAFAVRPLP